MNRLVLFCLIFALIGFGESIYWTKNSHSQLQRSGKRAYLTDLMVDPNPEETDSEINLRNKRFKKIQRSYQDDSLQYLVSIILNEHLNQREELD